MQRAKVQALIKYLESNILHKLWSNKANFYKAEYVTGEEMDFKSNTVKRI